MLPSPFRSEQFEELVERYACLAQDVGEDEWLDDAMSGDDGLGEGLIAAHHEVAAALAALVEAEAAERGDDPVRRKLRVPGHGARPRPR
jgi:hypothetical protein